jgi:hypothetical protein
MQQEGLLAVSVTWIEVMGKCCKPPCSTCEVVVTERIDLHAQQQLRREATSVRAAWQRISSACHWTTS